MNKDLDKSRLINGAMSRSLHQRSRWRMGMRQPYASNWLCGPAGPAKTAPKFDLGTEPSASLGSDGHDVRCATGSAKDADRSGGAGEPGSRTVNRDPPEGHRPAVTVPE
jgi:hypothetical protein